MGQTLEEAHPRIKGVKNSFLVRLFISKEAKDKKRFKKNCKMYLRVYGNCLNVGFGINRSIS